MAMAREIGSKSELQSYYDYKYLEPNWLDLFTGVSTRSFSIIIPNAFKNGPKNAKKPPSCPTRFIYTFSPADLIAANAIKYKYFSFRCV